MDLENETNHEFHTKYMEAENKCVNLENQLRSNAADMDRLKKSFEDKTILLQEAENNLLKVESKFRNLQARLAANNERKDLDDAIRSVANNDWISDTVVTACIKHYRPLVDEKNILHLDPSTTLLIKNDSTEPKDLASLIAPLDMLSYKYLIFFVSDSIGYNEVNTTGSHWSLLVIELSSKICFHLDSVPGYNTAHAKKLSKNYR